MVSPQTSAVIATNGILAVLAVAAVILRIAIRKQKILILQVDDYLILGALVIPMRGTDIETVLMSNQVLFCSPCHHQYCRCSHRWFRGTVRDSER